MEILCFYAGIACVTVNAFYPLLFMGVSLYFRSQLRRVGWFLAGIAWALAHSWWMSPVNLSAAPVIQEAELVGQIASIPVSKGDSVQFLFIANQLNAQLVHATFSLACYAHCPTLHVGERWRVIAKLKMARNLGNPGGFNYVNWCTSRHIHRTGTIRRGSFKPLSSLTKPSWVQRTRTHLIEKTERLDPDEGTLGIIQALTLGVTTHIDKTQWDLFRHTGTTHLIDISGAHIGLIAGLTFAFINWLWSRISVLCLYCPSQKIAAFSAFLMAAFYTFISGFTVPAQRALIACTLMLCRYFLKHRFSVWQTWRYALLSVLVLEPHSTLFPGFYLSFIGVAILILVNQRVVGTGLRKRFALQVACLVGMMPLTLFWFSYGAVNGLIANIVAIPWVELLIVPLALLTTACPFDWPIASMMFVLKHSISLFVHFLQWVDSFSEVNFTFSFDQIASPLALMGGLCVSLFLPLKKSMIPTIILLLSALFPRQIKTPHGEARIDLLDIGQGLSVVISTAHHVLIYDTGMKFFQGGDMAKIAIIPYLKNRGIHKIDAIVISHPDLDHRGGLESLEESYPVGELIVDAPEFYHRGSPCHHYPNWEWDGITFRFFALPSLPHEKNNHSCVLQIANSSGSVLLTGDIEQWAEDRLVTLYGSELASTVLLVPHHGSKTSSSGSFVEHVSPNYAIVSYGFDNRYHFPHSLALSAYSKRKIPLLNTVDSGMVTVILDRSDKMKPPTTYIKERGLLNIG